jgi:hypothetical protein
MNNKEWTIMIYMAGDNNLSVDMAYAMEQIKGVAGEGAESPNLFVYYDGNSPAIPTLYCDFSEPDRPKYVRSFMVPDKLYPVPPKHNENAAHKNSILNFVDWCLNKVEVENGGETAYGRRARKYALIFSGHSLGFQDIGLFKDETSGKSMKMEDLFFTLRRIVDDKKCLAEEAKKKEAESKKKFSDEGLKRETKVLLGRKLDILGFDSCVMGMLEVGYQFATVAEMMIASEGSVPSAGWTYAKILGGLACGDGHKGSSEKVVEQFVRKFIKSQDAYTVGGVSVDMAAWDLGRFRGLATAFDELSGLLVELFKDEGSRLYRRMAQIITWVHWQCQSYMYDQNIDLGDFCELLARECGLFAEELTDECEYELAAMKFMREACGKVLRELKKAVILSGFSGGAYQYSNGISVFFPWSREGYEVSRKNYEGLWFAREAERGQFAWSSFLRKYLYEVSLRKVEPTTPAAPPGSKYRYDSGIRFAEPSASTTFAGQVGSKMAGQEGSKMAGQEGSKMAGQEGSKMAGQEGSKMAGQEGSKMAGQEGSKMAGQEGSKMAGQEGSKMAGQEGSKMAGQEGSKMAGQEGSKMAGQEGSKMAGQEGSKMAGGGSNAFFNSLRLYKNIESRWDISGFTKRPEEPVPETNDADG